VSNPNSNRTLFEDAKGLFDLHAPAVHAHDTFGQIALERQRSGEKPRFLFSLVAQEYDDGEQAWLDLDDEDALTQIQGASIRYGIAVGPTPERKPLRLRTPGADPDRPQQPKPLTAARYGFSLNAALACKADERRKLERLCRYVERRPAGADRSTPQHSSQS